MEEQTEKTPNQKKRHAIVLLHKYDRLRRVMRDLEQELHEACVAYGRTQGYGERYNKDHLRTLMLIEQERKGKAA